MPNEMMTITLKPANFFTLNPSNDVPRSSQAANKSSLVENGVPNGHKKESKNGDCGC
jgi:primary-amine oxidase